MELPPPITVIKVAAKDAPDETRTLLKYYDLRVLRPFFAAEFIVVVSVGLITAAAANRAALLPLPV